MNNILYALFKTGALKTCSPDKPFWYTSGTIGPYYINTHFLYGSGEKAVGLLKFIDDNKEDSLRFPGMILKIIYENYLKDTVFREVSDELVKYILKNINENDFDYISGGERRDWFFSFIASKLLNKPHLALYKDQRAILSDRDGNTYEVESIEGMRVLHIADLITEASSYERAWLPAIKKLKASMPFSFVIVDRNQGGADFFRKNDITYHPMVNIDEETFAQALKMGLIDEPVFNMIISFIKDPRNSMREFLIKNPDFIDNTIIEGSSNSGRALMCKENNIYDL